MQRPLNDYGDILIPRDIQSILRIGRNSVYKLLDNGEIKSIRVGNSYRIPKQYLIDYIYPCEKEDAENEKQ